MISSHSMIKDYKKIEFIQKLSPYCSFFKVQKKSLFYFMYEFTEMNQCDQYNFKIIKKLVTCTHVPQIIQKFEENKNTYFIIQYFPSNLLKQQLKRPNQIFQLSKALQIFGKLVQLIEQIHQNKVIYRNFRLQTIFQRENQLYLFDFNFSQIVKRRERYFQPVGVTNYMAPQFYLQDGYGFEVDIWAAGVCLYYMLTGSYPFDLQGKNTEQILKQIYSKCKKGFSFQKNAAGTNFNKNLLGNANLNDLFRKLFEIDYTKRITIEELEEHSSIKQYSRIQNKTKKYELSIIEEQNNTIYSSIFVSMLKNFPSHYEFHKEEIILDFLERSSQIFMLQSPQIIKEEIKILMNFSILKVAILKVNNLIEVLYEKRRPQFKIDNQEWKEMKLTAGFRKVRQKIEKKKKILEMLFRAACLNIKNFKQRSNFYSEQISEDFPTMKHEYRKNLSLMFELEKFLIKKKESKSIYRRTYENMTRLTILCMINRIFSEKQIKKNFELYFEWSKKQSMEDLQQWIQTERLSNLKAFIINITTKYMIE